MSTGKTSLLETARGCIENGEWRKAERLLKQAGRESHDDLTRTEITGLVGQLAAAYKSLSRSTQAVTILKWGAEFAQSIADKVPYGNMLRALGETYGDTSRFDVAVRHLAKALEIHQEALGEDHRETVHDLNVLAWLAQKMGQPSRAAELYQAAVERLERSAGPSSIDLVMPLKARAAALLETDLPHEDACEPAEACLKRALQLQESYEMESTPVGWTLLDLSDLAQDHERCDEARDDALRAWMIGKAHINEDAALFNEATNWLKWWYEVHEELPPLNDLLTTALEIEKTTLGAGHPRVAETMGSLGQALLRADRLDEADSMCARAFEILTTHYGEMPAQNEFVEGTLNDVARIRLSLSSVLFTRATIALQRNRIPAARYLARRALLLVDLPEQDLTEDTRGVLTTARADLLRQLAHCSSQEGEVKEAERLFQQAVGEARKGDAEALAEALDDFADWLESLGRDIEAARHRKEADRLRDA